MILQNKTEVSWSGNALGEERKSLSNYYFQNWGICLRQRAKCSDGQPFQGWLLAAKFNYMRFISNPRSMPDEDEYISDVMPVTRSPTVIFEETYTSQADYFISDTVSIPTIWGINGKEKLVIDYDSDYIFEWTCSESHFSKLITWIKLMIFSLLSSHIYFGSPFYTTR